MTDEPTPEPLYLIAHRVRGELAFDVAVQMFCGAEEAWIIPTSGHRAYPFWHMLLSTFLLPNAGDMPEGLRDHYAISEPLFTPLRRRASSGPSGVADLL